MSNFLDLRCPHCGDTNRIDIEATVRLRVTESGTDADLSGNGDHELRPRTGRYAGAGAIAHMQESAAPG